MSALTVTTDNAVLHIDRLPPITRLTYTRPLDRASAARTFSQIVDAVVDGLAAQLADVLPEPRPARKLVTHDDKGRINEVREYPADASKQATARAIAAELYRRYYLPELIEQL